MSVSVSVHVCVGTYSWVPVWVVLWSCSGSALFCHKVLFLCSSRGSLSPAGCIFPAFQLLPNGRWNQDRENKPSVQREKPFDITPVFAGKHLGRLCVCV